MSKPVILAIDDEPGVLRAVERDLRGQYASDYRIVGAGGGEEAIETLRELALQDVPVALILADQRMPTVTGVAVLKRSLDLHPDAKKALLTAYADTDAAISAINDVGLDHYIMKPWDPPEERLFPILDDLLDDWAAHYRPVFEGVRVVGQQWSRETHELKAFLTKNQIPYRSLDYDLDETARRLAEEAGAGPGDLPLVLLPEAEPLRNPTPAQVAEMVGLTVHAANPAYDLAIVGAGPAGLAAAVYGSSEGLSTLLIEERAPGGQAGESSRIENYLGFPKGLSGADLARRAVIQARRFGTEILVPASVSRVARNDPFRIIHLDDGSAITCKAILITTGVSYRKLPGEGIDDLAGRGIYYGTSRVEASQHRDEPIFVVGGGNSAGQAALFLTGFSDSVTILVRGDTLTESMSQYLVDNIAASERVQVRYRTKVVAAKGEQRLRTLVLEDRDTGTREELDAGAVFIFIGQSARTDWLADLVALDERGFILTGTDLGPVKGWNVDRDPLPLETSVPGVFAAGDVRHGAIQRVAGATGEGATAIRFVHQHLAAL